MTRSAAGLIVLLALCTAGRHDDDDDDVLIDGPQDDGRAATAIAN